jgi:hypothetical protein
LKAVFDWLLRSFIGSYLFFVLGGEGERKEKRVRQTRTDSDLGRTEREEKQTMQQKNNNVIVVAFINSK